MMIFRSTDLFRETYIFSRAGFRMFPGEKRSFTGVALWKNVFYSNFSLPSTLVILQIASKTLFIYLFNKDQKKILIYLQQNKRKSVNHFCTGQVIVVHSFSPGAIILVFLLLLVNLWLIFYAL